jgi:hypothetical protein
MLCMRLAAVQFVGREESVAALGLFTIYGIRLRRQWAPAVVMVVVVTIAAVTTLGTLPSVYY